MKQPYTIEEMQSVFRLENDGSLVWLVKSGRSKVGKTAGTDANGYVVVFYKGVSMMAHRIVWLLTHKEWPAGMLDHVDGNRSNNRPSNLRLCDIQQNAMNRGKQANNKSGFKGVSVRQGKSGIRYRVACSNTYVGTFSNPIEAAAAYDIAASKMHGEFANTNNRSAA